MAARISRRQDDFEWFPFEPGDWLTDNGLAMSSLAAQGLWINLLCRMWRSNIRGVLTGDVTALSALVGRSEAEVRPLLEELAKNKVFSRGREVGDGLPEDAIVNRRMYREWSIRRKRAEAGRKGGQKNCRLGIDDCRLEEGRTSLPRRVSAGADRHPSTAENTNPGDCQLAQANAKQNAENVKQNQQANAGQTASKINAVTDNNVNGLHREQASKTQANVEQNEQANVEQRSLENKQRELRSKSTTVVTGQGNRSTTPSAAGDVAQQLLCRDHSGGEDGQSANDAAGVYVSLLSRATNDTFTWTDALRYLLERILSHPAGKRHLDDLISRLEGGHQPEKGWDVITKPASFANKCLRSIAAQLGVSPGSAERGIERR